MSSRTSHFCVRLVSGIATLFGVAIAGVAGAQSTAGYHVTQRIPLGGEGGWDYIAVDTASRSTTRPITASRRRAPTAR
jgi:hypothetical protein